MRAVTRVTRAQAPNFHELYDNSKDPYQLANGWHNATERTQSALLQQLRQVWGCQGQQCP